MIARKFAVVGAGCTLVLGLAACGGGSDSASKPASETKSLTFVSFGGAYQDAQKTAMTDPYTAANSIEMKQDGPTDYAKIKAMVESNNVLWDVVDADPFFAIGNCDKYAEKLDFSVIDTSKMPKEFVSDCAVPSMTYSYVLMYNTKKYPNPPQGWADFFDTAKFPGKRALQNAAQGGGYEAALLADGVAKDQLYPLDYDRAEKKLDTIKKDLIFWDSGAQSQQMMEKGEVDMLLAWTGRGYNAVKNGATFAPQWNENMAVYDVFMVPKGTKNKAAAMKFIAYATGAEAQAKLTETIPYSPINSDAKPTVDKLIKSFLSTEPGIAEKGIVQDQAWWAKNQDAATEKWTAWAAG
ncbi:MAG: polyamine ABC transporter substrate-binding protein [Pedococcus sp.]